ncbi:MAG: hypothetical protein ACRDY6_15705 [Acidimicrobiia bacterium]
MTERIGLDLILPLAAMLPFERHIRWAEQKQVAAKVLEELMSGAGALANAIGKLKLDSTKAVSWRCSAAEPLRSALYPSSATTNSRR